MNLSAGGLGGSALLSWTSQPGTAAEEQDKIIHRNEKKTMTYRQLGRTRFMSSRLVFGCGAALAGGRGVRLLDRAFEAGINHFDVGSDIYYKGSEKTLAPFLKAHRDDVWAASKAPLSPKQIDSQTTITSDIAKSAAKFWTSLLDASLKDLQTDYIDAYYLMAVDNCELILSEEIQSAISEAKSAGKIGFSGVSTHKNAGNILDAAIKANCCDVAMIGITPAGWYDWTTKELEQDTPPLTQLLPLLQKAQKAGVGLIGMKTARYLAPMNALGKGDANAFDAVYSKKFLAAPLSPFQRSCAYVLEHGLDVVISDMQNFKHLEENIIAASKSHTYFG
ncbi:MAG: aldo/keto reductase [Candidatus Omnitrophica bacterium]|nr:aldo/keto reductase [Candidatus Omnitrophota bacterium]